MKQVLLGDIINRGSDNIFGNTGDGGTTPQTERNNNNIERVDFVATGGLSAPSAALSQIGFLILERGGNDAFKIAPITAIDGQGNPTAYGNVVSIEIDTDTNPWGPSGIQIATQVLRKDDAESFLTRTNSVGNQRISSIFFSYQSLGITDSQVFYGYSLVGGDVNVGMNPNSLLDIENENIFPRNTSSTSGATGGLDLIASGGVFALSTLNTLDVEVTKESNVSEASPGQTITYTITVRNNDPSATATNYRVIDNLPPELINAEWTCASTEAADCNPSDSSSTTKTGTGSIDELVTIPPQQSVTYTVTATIGQNVQVGETISNTAQISPTGEQIDSISSNNTSTADITVSTDLEVSKTVDNIYPIQGTEIQYIITVKNNGPSTANNVEVNELLPNNLTYISHKYLLGNTNNDPPTDGSTISSDVAGILVNPLRYNPNTGIWDVGTLAVNQTAFLYLHARVNTDSGTITNTVTVPPDLDNTNNEDSLEIFPQAPDDSKPLVCDTFIAEFNWDNPDINWPEGKNGTESYSVGGVGITLTTGLTDNAEFTSVTGFGNTPNDNELFTRAGLNPPGSAKSLHYQIDPSQQGAGATLTIEFDQLIDNVELDVRDIDINTGGSWSDKVVFYGFNGNDFVAPKITPVASNPVLVVSANGNGNMVYGTGDAPNQTSNRGDVLVSFNSPVDKIELFFSDYKTTSPFNPSNHGIGMLGTLKFCSPEPVSSDPNVLLVKRITSINGTTNTKPNGQDMSAYNNDPNYAYDENSDDLNNPNLVTVNGRQIPPTTFWPDTTANTASNFLIGAINGGEIEPGDTVEYTVYFLSAGDTEAKNVLVCDRIPDNMTFVPNSFGEGLGIRWGYDVNSDGTLTDQDLTNINDGDAGTYFPPGLEPNSFIGSGFSSVNCGGINNTGAVVVKLGDLPPATAPGDPTTSYGYIRFRAKLNDHN
ncbi:MAG: hypothetical protein ACXITR_10620 [Cyanobacterium sp.]